MRSERVSKKRSHRLEQFLLSNAFVICSQIQRRCSFPRASTSICISLHTQREERKKKKQRRQGRSGGMDANQL